MKNWQAVFTTILVCGCATFQAPTPAKKLVFERGWTRSTLAQDYLFARKPHRMSPLLVENMVIVSNSYDGLVAYSQSSGAQLWKLAISNGSEAGAKFYNGQLFLGASDGQFYCVDAYKGKVVWTFNARSETLSEPLIAEDKVFFVSGNNVLYALEAKTGKQLWLYNRIDTANLTIRGAATPVLKDGNLYVGFSDGFFLAFHASDGSVVWERQLTQIGKFHDIDATAVIEGKSIYVSGYDGSLYALTKEDGQIIWKLDEGGFSQVLVDGDVLYYPTSTRKVMAVEKNTGRKIWSIDLKNGIASQLVKLGDTLFFGESGGGLMSISKQDGRVLTQFHPGRGVFAPPLVDEKKKQVFVISNEGNLYQLRYEWRDPRSIVNWLRL